MPNGQYNPKTKQTSRPIKRRSSQRMPNQCRPADNVLFVNRKPAGTIKTKREDTGYRITVVEDQPVEYARAKFKYLDNDLLPFAYESAGTITRICERYHDRTRPSVSLWYFHCFPAGHYYIRL